MAFEPIRQVIKNMGRITQRSVLTDLVENRGIDKLIIELNTRGKSTSQLFNLNVDSKGVSLSDIGGDYSPLTLQLSQEKGRPKKSASAINLFDTGDFYGTWQVKVAGDTIVITANPQKDDSNLFDDWGEDVVGLTEDNLQIMIDEIKAILPQDTKEKLLSGVA